MIARSALIGRVLRLEQRQGSAGPGMSALLADIRRHAAVPERPPLTALSDEELEAKRAGLIGEPGFAVLLLDCVEAERARRSIAAAKW